MDLDEFLAEPDGFSPPPDDDEGRQRWSIVAYPPAARDKIASWCFRRLAVVQAERDRIAVAAHAERERIVQWEADADRPLYRDAAFFEGCLTEYLRHIREERGEDPAKPRTKSYKLPTGTISGRAGSESILVLDEAKFIAWAKESGYPELVRTKEEVAKDKIKEAIGTKDGVSIVLTTGERAPFIEVKKGAEKLSAKPSAVVEHG